MLTYIVNFYNIQGADELIIVIRPELKSLVQEETRRLEERFQIKLSLLEASPEVTDDIELNISNVISQIGLGWDPNEAVLISFGDQPFLGGFNRTDSHRCIFNYSWLSTPDNKTITELSAFTEKTGNNDDRLLWRTFLSLKTIL
ncbi:MAG: hypothetical protein Q9M91_02445 [Candidatus Dojkabacteria bacterium]|nr:hypothetical protein [Candidatus Dojkabacteria bacterium]